MINNSPYSIMTSRIIESMVWTKDLTTPEWCRQNIYLGRLVTPYVGMMSFERTPWIEEILLDWDKPWIEFYNIMASTQVGKTTIEFCCITKELDTDPCMMSLAVASDKQIPGLLRKKINPFFDGVEVLQEKMKLYVSEEKKRNLDAIKQVPGGMFTILGNTEKNRKGDSVQKLFGDEVSMFAKGDVKEWIGRTKFYEKTGRKVFLISSRDHEGDEMQLNYENSYCKKDLMIECQGCKKYFYPESKHFKYMTEKQYKDKYNLEEIEVKNDYKREAIKTAHVLCDCGFKTTSIGLEDLVRNKKVKLKVISGSESDTNYGYRLNALATGLTRYSTMAEALIEAGSDFVETNRIYKDYFNEIYEAKELKIESSDISKLSNGYEELEIPDDTIGLYMGVDSQKGYYWVTILAIEYDIKSHLVWCGRVEDEATIEAFMDREYFYKDGQRYTQGIRRAYHDWQGYKTIQSEEVQNEETGEFVQSLYMDMPQRTKEFALRMAEKYGADSDGRERYYAVRGVQNLDNDKAYMEKDMGVKLQGFKEERKIKTLVVNTTWAKSTFLSQVGRSVAKMKAATGNTSGMTEEDIEKALDYKERLHYINDTQAEKLQTRKKILNIDYDMQITSQVWGIWNKDKFYSFKSKNQRDDHYSDTNSYIMMSIVMDMLVGIPKPVRKDNTKKFSLSKRLSGR